MPFLELCTPHLGDPLSEGNSKIGEMAFGVEAKGISESVVEKVEDTADKEEVWRRREI